MRAVTVFLSLGRSCHISLTVFSMWMGKKYPCADSLIQREKGWLWTYLRLIEWGLVVTWGMQRPKSPSGVKRLFLQIKGSPFGFGFLVFIQEGPALSCSSGIFTGTFSDSSEFLSPTLSREECGVTTYVKHMWREIAVNSQIFWGTLPDTSFLVDSCVAVSEFNLIWTHFMHIGYLLHSLHGYIHYICFNSF